MFSQRRFRILACSPALAFAGLGLLTLAACERAHEEPRQETRAEMAWARAALERNPHLEVVAADPDAGLFTVRDRGSGEVRTVKLNDLAAAPVSQLAAQRAAEPAAAVAEAAPVADSTAAAESLAVAPSTNVDDPSMAQPAAAERPQYTIERSASGVKVSGPGVAIVSAGGAQGTASARNEPGQRTVQPIVCEGRHMMHIDNRRIFVDGDAITALNGCQLFITNSRIVASGTGVVVRDSEVHITNSYIEGATGSYDAGIGARLFIQGSTFNGVMHRDAFAQIQEQDGDAAP